MGAAPDAVTALPMPAASTKPAAKPGESATLAPPTPAGQPSPTR